MTRKLVPNKLNETESCKDGHEKWVYLRLFCYVQPIAAWDYMIGVMV